MEKILIIDDSWIARLKIGDTLKKAGYEVMETPSGEEGLILLSEEKPDLVLLDLLMPGMDGIEVLRLIKERKIPVPVIIVTADIQETTRTECLKEGARDIIHKPPRDPVLLDSVNRVLQARKSSGE